ncbi:putative effector of murein hydrolase LrgA (UPF0299 family) [Microbacterium dextranolyticum]|uniref:Uncharacterized protein n=1 Tax=Microbacterium dextranolyticum TaxID=36806 RepID=A0A9W6HMX5_9MICO|nr:putative effector of murein hydrolase LrgA (UPF0299 family) [Microbacterium dextranolyticum]GLJ95704.1 hypothetical protein GCM10017591_17670 [Microbacterium dextranolyticum]
MRRLFSFQAGRALFGSVTRVLIVFGSLLAYYLLAMWVEPYVPWWLTTVVGFVLLFGLLYLGSVWLDHDIMRGAKQDSSERGRS